MLVQPSCKALFNRAFEEHVVSSFSIQPVGRWSDHFTFTIHLTNGKYFHIILSQSEFVNLSEHIDAMSKCSDVRLDSMPNASDHRADAQGESK
jgi:hypothetical protein